MIQTLYFSFVYLVLYYIWYIFANTKTSINKNNRFLVAFIHFSGIYSY